MIFIYLCVKMGIEQHSFTPSNKWGHFTSDSVFPRYMIPTGHYATLPRSCLCRPNPVSKNYISLTL